LLVEEYPLAERDLHREEGKWVLRTTVQALEGKKLVEYVKRYDKKWVQKI